jgi:hypothetical protein
VLSGDTDRAVLDLEARFWKHQGTKEAAIRTELGLTPVRYYQRLARLLDDPAALAYAPAAVRRAGRRAGRHSVSTDTGTRVLGV